jgi:hypothetical protein
MKLTAIVAAAQARIASYRERLAEAIEMSGF